MSHLLNTSDSAISTSAESDRKISNLASEKLSTEFAVTANNKNATEQAPVISDSMKKVFDFESFAVSFENRQPKNKAEEPSESERSEAQKRLEETTSGLISVEDRKTLTQMQEAILAGDTKSFGDTIARFKDQPEKLQEFVKAMNDNFEKAGSNVRANIDSKGQVIIHDGRAEALVYSADGKVSVHEVKNRADGGTTVGGEILNSNTAEDTAKQIGNRAIDDINKGKDAHSKSESKSILDDFTISDRGSRLPDPEVDSEEPEDRDPGYKSYVPDDDTNDRGYSMNDNSPITRDPGFQARKPMSRHELGHLFK